VSPAGPEAAHQPAAHIATDGAHRFDMAVAGKSRQMRLQQWHRVQGTLKPASKQHHAIHPAKPAKASIQPAKASIPPPTTCCFSPAGSCPPSHPGGGTSRTRPWCARNTCRCAHHESPSVQRTVLSCWWHRPTPAAAPAGNSPTTRHSKQGKPVAMEHSKRSGIPNWHSVSNHKSPSKLLSLTTGQNQ
jgi:hypothetical protein